MEVHEETEDEFYSNIPWTQMEKAAKSRIQALTTDATHAGHVPAVQPEPQQEDDSLSVIPDSQSDEEEWEAAMRCAKQRISTLARFSCSPGASRSQPSPHAPRNPQSPDTLRTAGSRGAGAAPGASPKPSTLPPARRCLMPSNAPTAPYVTQPSSKGTTTHHRMPLQHPLHEPSTATHATLGAPHPQPVANITLHPPVPPVKPASLHQHSHLPQPMNLSVMTAQPPVPSAFRAAAGTTQAVDTTARAVDTVSGPDLLSGPGAGTAAQHTGLRATHEPDLADDHHGALKPRSSQHNLLSTGAPAATQPALQGPHAPGATDSRQHHPPWQQPPQQQQPVQYQQDHLCHQQQDQPPHQDQSHQHSWQQQAGGVQVSMQGNHSHQHPPPCHNPHSTWQQYTCPEGPRPPVPHSAAGTSGTHQGWSNHHHQTRHQPQQPWPAQGSGWNVPGDPRQQVQPQQHVQPGGPHGWEPHHAQAAQRPRQHQAWPSSTRGVTTGPVAAHAASRPPRPRTGPGKPPYPCCPGVYMSCGAPLVSHTSWWGGSQRVYWACSTRPACNFLCWPPERVQHPQVTLEVTGPAEFSVMVFPGAEDAVWECGGLRAVLARARVDLSLACASSTVGAGGPSSTVAQCGSGGQGACGDSHTGTGAESNTAADLHTAAAGRSGEGDSEDSERVVFPLAAYEKVEAALRAYKRNLLPKSSLIPRSILKIYRGEGKARVPEHEVDALVQCMPCALRSALMPFQLEGVRFGLERHGRVLIADEMGVGKTVQAMALAACYQDEWPVLVVAPASMRLVWAEELEKWMPHLRPSQIHVIEGKEGRLSLEAGQDRATLPLVTVTSYEMMRRLSCDACCTGPVRGSGGDCDVRRLDCQEPRKCMASLPWGVVIVDESHTLRTTNARQQDAPHTEACCAAASRARRVIMLTGTPSLSRPYDLFRQVDTLRPGLVGRSKEEFSERFCERRLVPISTSGHDTRRKWFNSGGSHLYELHGVLRREVMIRRLKRAVLGQLPPKIRSVVRLPHPGKDRWPGGKMDLDEGGADQESDGVGVRRSGSSCGAEGTGIVSGGHLEGVSGMGEEEEAEQQLVAAKKMSREHRTALAKLKDVVDWLMGMLEGSTTSGGEDQHEGPAKFLVFAHHRDVMDSLAAELLTYKSPTAASAAAEDLEDGGPGGAGSNGGPGGETDRANRAAARRGVPFVRVDGTHTSQERHEAVVKFRTDPTVRVALLSITAAAVGLDFSSASVVVFVELPYEVALVRQAEDRAHRKGTTKSVNVYFLVAKGTVDESRWQRLDSSLMAITQVQDGPAPDLDTAPGAGAGAGGTDVARGLQVHQVLEHTGRADLPAPVQPAGQMQPLAVTMAASALPCLGPEQQAEPAAQAGAGEPVQGDMCLDEGMALVEREAMHIGGTASGSPGPVLKEPGLGCAVMQQNQEVQAMGGCADEPVDAEEAAVGDEDRDEVLSTEEIQIEGPGWQDEGTLGVAGEDAEASVQTLGQSEVQVVSGEAPVQQPAVSSGRAGAGAEGGEQVPARPRVAVQRQVDCVIEVSDSEDEDLNVRQGSTATARATLATGVGAAHHASSSPATAKQLSAAGCVEEAPSLQGAGVEGANVSTPKSKGRRIEVIELLTPDSAPKLAKQASPRSRPRAKDSNQASLKRRAEGSVAVGPCGVLQGDGASTGAGAGEARPAKKRKTPSGKTPAWGKGAAFHGRAQPAAASLPTLAPAADNRSHLTGGPEQIASRAEGLLQAAAATTRPVWYEVSPNTGRLHLHLAADGSRPLGLNLPTEAITNSQGLDHTLTQVCTKYEAVQGQLLQVTASIQNRMADLLYELQQASAAPTAQTASDAAHPQLLGSQPNTDQAPEVHSTAPRTASQELIDAAPAQQVPKDTSYMDPVVPAEPAAPAARRAITVAQEAIALLASVAPGFMGPSGLVSVVPIPVLTVPQGLPQSPGTTVASQQPAGLQQLGQTGQQGQQGELQQQGDNLWHSVQVSVQWEVLSVAELREAIREAAQFAREWRELRAVTRSRLQGKVLTATLQDAVDVANAEAMASGAFGSSTARYLKDALPALPAGAEWKTVKVRSNRGATKTAVLLPGDKGRLARSQSLEQQSVPVYEYQQAFLTSTGQRLCLTCSKPILDAPPADAVLRSVSGLFCSAPCEDKHWLKASNGAIRRALAKLERGVCTACGLDCRSLVLALQSIRHGSEDWLERRRTVLRQRYPRLLEGRYKALADRLLNQALEGYAWQADHIVPVYMGGGLCELDNMRTLCVACHADVTRAQARERREERARQALGTRDIRQFFSPPQGAKADPKTGQPRKSSGQASGTGAAKPPSAPVTGATKGARGSKKTQATGPGSDAAGTTQHKQVAAVTDTTASEPPAKKRRGRPPKVVAMNTGAVHAAAAPMVARTGRGPQSGGPTRSGEARRLPSVGQSVSVQSASQGAVSMAESGSVASRLRAALGAGAGQQQARRSDGHMSKEDLDHEGVTSRLTPGHTAGDISSGCAVGADPTMQDGVL